MPVQPPVRHPVLNPQNPAVNVAVQPLYTPRTLNKRNEEILFTYHQNNTLPSYRSEESEKYLDEIEKLVKPPAWALKTKNMHEKIIVQHEIGTTNFSSTLEAPNSTKTETRKPSSEAPNKKIDLAPGSSPKKQGLPVANLVRPRHLVSTGSVATNLSVNPKNIKLSDIKTLKLKAQQTGSKLKNMQKNYENLRHATGVRSPSQGQIENGKLVMSKQDYSEFCELYRKQLNTENLKLKKLVAEFKKQENMKQQKFKVAGRRSHQVVGFAQAYSPDLIGQTVEQAEDRYSRAYHSPLGRNQSLYQQNNMSTALCFKKNGLPGVDMIDFKKYKLSSDQNNMYNMQDNDCVDYNRSDDEWNFLAEQEAEYEEEERAEEEQEMDLEYGNV